jgi:CHASE2 domain-containing sensor protein
MDPFFVRSLRLLAYDHLQRLDPEPYNPNLPIRIVDIDEKSLSVIGQWSAADNCARSIIELTSRGRSRRFDVLLRTRPHFARAS